MSATLLADRQTTKEVKIFEIFCNVLKKSKVKQKIFFYVFTHTHTQKKNVYQLFYVFIRIFKNHTKIVN